VVAGRRVEMAWVVETVEQRATFVTARWRTFGGNTLQVGFVSHWQFVFVQEEATELCRRKGRRAQHVANPELLHMMPKKK